jgi:hypothetical protein
VTAQSASELFVTVPFLNENVAVTAQKAAQHVTDSGEFLLKHHPVANADPGRAALISWRMSE